MRFFQHYSQGLVACLLMSGAVVLSGCGANASFPNAEAVNEPTLRAMPAIQGSNYGGHAPIVGAHIFLLQVGTGGYGSAVTSLLGSSSANSSYPTAQDTTPGSPTYGMWYVTSDSTGQYNLTGDYTCTAGDPVYVYGSGGNPSTNPNNGYSVTITGASAAPDANGNLLVTFTTTGNQLLYQGETVAFGTQSPSNTAYYQFAGTTGVVSPLNLTTTTFAIEQGPSSTTVGYASFSETATQVTPVVNNPAIANMAVLGTCPGTFTIQAIPNGSGTTTISGISNSDFAKLAVGDTISGPGLQYPGTATTTISALTPGSGTTTNSITVSCASCFAGVAEYGGNPAGPYYTYTVNTPTNVFNFGPHSTDAVSYVYMNEISTVAAAFALAPFASTTANNDALHIGTSSTNLAGVQNAVLTANNLYDITGHNSGTGSNGDVHIARLATPTNPTGSSVPQSLIDTIGNILANCVDSANTYGATNTSGTKSAQCSTLFNTATSDGTSTGTKPYDTATAALNIAHHPAGNGGTTSACGGTVSAFACTLYNGLTGNVPFQPYLGSAPNDFSVGITYSGSGLTGANGVAIDASGDAWIPTTGGAVVELSPTGAVLSGATGFSSGTTNPNSSLTIDLSGNVWFVNNIASVMKMNSIGTLLSGAGGYSTGTNGCASGSPTPHSLAIDKNNNVWVANYYGDDRGQAIVELNNNGALQTGNEVNTNNTVCNDSTAAGNTVVRNVWGIVMDGNGVMYGTGYSSENVAAVNTSTTNGSYTIFNNSGATSVPDAPGYAAIDQNGKLWMPNYYGYVSSTNTAGAGTSVSVFTPPSIPSATTNATTTAAYTSYSGGGLNGPGAIAVDGGNNIWVAGVNNKYLSELSNNGTALTPSTGYTGGITNTVGRVAIDSAGNAWVNSAAGNNVVQMVGVATPTLTPIATAATNGTPAAKP
jgi:hypothetical protein